MHDDIHNQLQTVQVLNMMHLHNCVYTTCLNIGGVTGLVLSPGKNLAQNYKYYKMLPPISSLILLAFMLFVLLLLILTSEDMVASK